MSHIIASQVGRVGQQSNCSEIRHCLIREEQNPNLDMECASEILALRRYGQILVGSYNTAVMPFPAKGSLGTELWDCVLGPGLSGPVPYSEDEKNNKFYFRRSF